MDSRVRKALREQLRKHSGQVVGDLVKQKENKVVERHLLLREKICQKSRRDPNDTTPTICDSST
jgi:hypothetical protein